MFTRLKKQKLNPLFIWLGLFGAIVAPVLYLLKDYKPTIVVLWGISLILLLSELWQKRSSPISNFGRRDIGALVALLVIFIPIYFFRLYEIPFQMNTDEAVIMSYQKIHLQDWNIFGTSDYFGFPAFVFIVFGKLVNLLGGINIIHARTVHAGFGIATIVLSYIFFRQFWKPIPAWVGAVILGANHSLIGISRMAMRDNSALFVTIASLLLLFFGLRNQNRFYSFLGGIMAGFSFYIYSPGRVFIFVWLLFLGLAFLFRSVDRKKLLYQAGFAILAFTLVVAPILVSELKSDDQGADKFTRERFLFLQEGREHQRVWVAAPTIKDGVLTNIKRGLTTFNNKVPDQGWIYPNFGHGFVDPVSGVLIWIGVGHAVWQIYRKRTIKLEMLLSLSGFLFFWLLFSFVINQSPNYTRLLMVLPFVAFWVVAGMNLIFDLIIGIIKKRMGNFQHISSAFMIGMAITVLVVNILIFGNFAKKGLAEGNDVGGTARYIEARKDLTEHQFIVVADKSNLYYGWAVEDSWQFWTSTFALESQQTRVLEPKDFLSKLPETNFTIFSNKNVWQQNQAQLLLLHPNLVVQNIMTNGSLVAVEVK